MTVCLLKESMANAFRGQGKIQDAKDVGVTGCNSGKGSNRGRGTNKNGSGTRGRGSGSGSKEQEEKETDPEEKARNNARSMTTLLDQKADKLTAVIRRLKGDRLKLSILKAAESSIPKLEAAKNKIEALLNSSNHSHSKLLSVAASAGGLVEEATKIIKAA